MKTFMTFLKRFHKDEKGVTLVEYGIALLVVVLVGGTAMIAIANNTSALFGGGVSATNDACTGASLTGCDDGT
jgi:Flp pilus assembly pilin Flp